MSLLAHRKSLAKLAALFSVVVIGLPVALATAHSSHHHRSRHGHRHGSKDPIALGVNLSNAPDRAFALRHYTKIAGRKPALVMWYQQWSEPLYYPDQAAHMKATRAVPVITWDPIENGVGIPLRQIIAGRYDSYIRASAGLARSYHDMMYVRLGHEMNLHGSPFGPGVNGNTPAEYVAAWRHVVKLFRAAHANNVKWVWSPNVDCAGQCPFSAFYPGSKWVDWVALDGYNYAWVDHVRWMTFDQIFAQSYRVLTHLAHKPVMIGEMATAGTGQRKAAWIKGAFSVIPRRYPRIRAVIWFDRNKETNWMINSSPQSTRAWRSVVHSAQYAAGPSTLSRADSASKRAVGHPPVVF